MTFVRLSVGALAIALALAASGCAGEADDGQAGEYVSFDTVDASPDWSPDGRLIAFMSSRRGGGLYVVRPDGKAMRRLLRGRARTPDWSPDGRRLAFAGRDGIYVMHRDGRRPRLVLRGRRLSLPTWRPDGRELALVKEESDLSTAIYTIRLDGKGLRRLLPRYRGALGEARPGSPYAVSETQPTWSPDGHSIAFQAGDGHLVVASLADGSRRELVAGGAYEPAWSPDGRLIAYQCEGQLCVVNADGGGDDRRIAWDGGAPSWAPDSRRIVFEHYLYGGSHYFSQPQSLSVVDAAGEEVRKLTFGPRPRSNR